MTLSSVYVTVFDLQDKLVSGIHHSRAVRSRPLSPLARSPTSPHSHPAGPYDRSPSPAKIVTTPTDEMPISPGSVERIMVQQLQAFSTSKTDISPTDVTGDRSKSGSAIVEPVSVIPAYLSSKMSRTGSSSITDGSSSHTGTTTTTTDMSHDGISEIESAEDSEKTQTTSDADDSEKHSDSGGDMTREESKGNFCHIVSFINVVNCCNILQRKVQK